LVQIKGERYSFLQLLNWSAECFVQLARVSDYLVKVFVDPYVKQIKAILRVA